jgi:predicted ester cyclase
MSVAQKSIEETNREQLLLALEHDGPQAALESLDKYYSADFCRHGDKGDYDKERLREGLRRLYAGFPDLKRVQFDIIAQGDKVAYRWEATGTHLGEYLGVRATNRPVITRGMVMCRFADGLIVEEWASWNKASLLHDLGIIPLGR